jgi:putative ABC transport system permease protein
MFQDFRFGIRMLWKQPAFSVIAILTLALGVGASTAIFSVVNGVLLRQLPFDQPERIVTLWENNTKDSIARDDVSPANFLDWRERSESFEALASANPYSLDYQGKIEPETWQAALVYAEQVLEKLRTVPGVTAAGVTTATPFLESSIDTSMPFTVEGRPSPPTGGEPTVYWTVASSDYFTAMGMSLRSGRMFDEYDTRSAPPVALINETMARRHFPNEDPIGRRLLVRGRQRDNPAQQPVTIVGIVSDIRHDGLDKEPRAEHYRPFTQIPSGSLTFGVRVSADAVSLIPALKARVWEVNPAQSIYAVDTMDRLVFESLKARRFSLLLLCAFASLALGLAVVGIYGVMSFATSQRTREIGLRIALGAQKRDVLSLILSQGARLTLSGVGIGLLTAWALTRLLTRLLYSVSATDPLVFGGVALLLTVVAMAACYLPARRAMKVDPLAALRHE